MPVWALVGISLFWLGWPWLWYDSLARLQAYWGTGVVRPTMLSSTSARSFADRDVPWHYPWFYFAVTVPLGLLLLGALGIVQGWKNRRTDPFPLLLAGTIVVFLVLFSTSVPVYDGERLFLHVFPAWALLIGLGFGWLWNHIAPRPFGRRSGRPGGIPAGPGLRDGLAAPVRAQLLQRTGRRTAGAERLGLELTYWNDAVDQVLLDRLAREGHAGRHGRPGPDALPAAGYADHQPRPGAGGIILQDEQEGRTCRVARRSRRTAYWRPEIEKRLRKRSRQTLATRSRQGVWLSALWHFPRGRAAARTARRVCAGLRRPTCSHADTIADRGQRHQKTCGTYPLPSSRRAGDS